MLGVVRMDLDWKNNKEEKFQKASRATALL